MAEVTVKITDNGPLLVKGRIELMDGEGNLMETKEQFALCRCGQSKNKPFCDGSHGPAGFNSSVRAAKAQLGIKPNSVIEPMSTLQRL